MTYQKSSTNIFGMYKPESCHYIGIDITCEGKRSHEYSYSNCHFVEIDSRNIDQIYDEHISRVSNTIDILMIDGNHSIDFMVNDWKYTKFLNKNGLVLIHDTNEHPGPNLVFDAISEKCFKKKKFFVDRMDDWGLAVCRRIEND